MLKYFFFIRILVFGFPEHLLIIKTDFTVEGISQNKKLKSGGLKMVPKYWSGTM